MDEDYASENGFDPKFEGHSLCGTQFRKFGCTQVLNHESPHVARGSRGEVKAIWTKGDLPANTHNPETGEAL